ncbi:hypothetical protein BC941DRAFT_470187 [Chlamydoabsidia padenii]|nr:hypothetical protein BC941DRAFT_470187 [Chlamydoabsidia padenii]
MASLSAVKSSASSNDNTGSVMVVSATGSAALTGDFSKLLGQTPIPTTTTTPTPTSTIITSLIIPTNTTALSSPTQSNSTSSTNDGLTNTQLGAIIGGATGGVLLLLCLIGCIIYRRQKNQTTFERGRGITPSMVLNNPDFQPQPQQQMTTFDQQSTYSFNSPQHAFGSSSHLTPSAPSENVTATVDKLYSIKQYNNDTTQPPSNNRGTTNGARLSKYNYLTQAFSQMRASHATPDHMYDNSHQGLAKPPYIQYPDPIVSSPSSSAPSITLFDENNKSQVLHQARPSPTISNKLHLPGGTNNRDSTLSDVSQYTTFSSNPFRYSDDLVVSSHNSNNNNNNNNTSPPLTKPSPLSEKPYTYI